MASTGTASCTYLPRRYFTVYEQMLAEVGTQHRERHCQLGAFVPQVGREYGTCRFMVVGRAVNGWGSPWVPRAMQDAEARHSLVRKIASNTFRTNWVYGYPSAFWRVTSRVLRALLDLDETSWADRLIWSNLDKLSYSDAGNPPSWLRRTQLPFVNHLLQIEHAHYVPDFMLVLAGEPWYGHRFDALGVQRQPFAEYAEGIGMWGTTKVVFAKHPQGKPEQEFTRQVLAAFKVLKDGS